jgi:hypothetical protein
VRRRGVGGDGGYCWWWGRGNKDGAFDSIGWGVEGGRESLGELLTQSFKGPRAPFSLNLRTWASRGRIVIK